MSTCIPIEVAVLGSFVRQRREALRLNQSELGERINRDQRYVSRLENNQKEFPEPAMIHALAEALDCAPAELLHAAGYLPDDAEVDDERALRMAVRIVNLPEAIRVVIDAAIEAGERRGGDSGL